MDYENWGCEFIDVGVDAKPPPKRTLEALWLPVVLLKSTVDRSYQGTLKTSKRERIEALMVSIAEYGLREHGILVVGRNSTKLQDGNHRFIACERLGWKYYPVRIKKSDSVIKTGSMQNDQFIMELIDTMKKHK